MLLCQHTAQEHPNTMTQPLKISVFDYLQIPAIFVNGAGSTPGGSLEVGVYYWILLLDLTTRYYYQILLLDTTTGH